MSDPEKSADAYGTEADLFAEPTGAPQVQPATELAVTAVSLGPSQSFGLAVPPAEGFSVTSEGVIPAGVRSVEEIVMMVEDETPTAAPADDLAMLPDDGLHLKEHLAEIEKTLILQAIARAGGNISQTARLLRLQRTTLIEKINKYSLRLP
jgi:sigma-54 specific flagellar transcriptional regulator A